MLKNIRTGGTSPRPAQVRSYVPKTRPQRTMSTIGRFTTDVENFHGRLAMLGLVGCGLNEVVSKTPIVTQFVSETGVSPLQITAFITVVTGAFILETINPITIKNEEPELSVFENPGFTLETEILHGRIAMLAFGYAILSEQLYSTLAL